MIQRHSWHGKANLLLLSMTLSTAGCGGREGGSATPIAPTASTSAVRRDSAMANSSTVLTDAECRKFGEDMKQALNAQNADAINALIDVDVLSAASTAGLELSEKYKSEFAESLSHSIHRSTGFTQQLINSLSQGGSADILRIVEVDGRKRVRMRLILAQEGVSYVDYLPGRNAAGQILAQDMYLFSSGELMSQTFRRMALALAATQDGGILQRLTSAENEYVTHNADIGSMMRAVTDGQPAEAMRIYNTLPAGIKKDKNLKILQVRIAQKISASEYERAITELQTAFPNDACVLLFSIDGYLLHKKYDKALAALDTLDRTVGGDPYLNVTRATVYMMQQKLSLAQQCMEKAVQSMPSNKDVNALLLVISLQNKRYQGVLNALIALKKAGDASPDIARNPEFAGFRRSPQYKQWQKFQ